MNLCFPSVSCESQIYLISKAFTTWVAAAVTSQVGAVATKVAMPEADRRFPASFCSQRAFKQCQSLFWFYWLVHANSHEITNCMFLSFVSMLFSPNLEKTCGFSLF